MLDIGTELDQPAGVFPIDVDDEVGVVDEQPPNPCLAGRLEAGDDRARRQVPGGEDGVGIRDQPQDRRQLGNSAVPVPDVDRRLREELDGRGGEMAVGGDVGGR